MALTFRISNIPSGVSGEDLLKNLTDIFSGVRSWRDHPDTLTSVDNLALVLGPQGK